MFSLCANAVLGALLYSARLANRVLAHRMEHAIKAEEVSRERLYAAWKSGAEIPPASAVADAPAEPEIPLSDALAAIVNDWEDERGRAAQLRFIRTRLAAGKSEAEILREVRPS